MRSAIGLLLMGAVAVGGCDRQSAPSPQANESIGNDGAAQTTAGLDRSHRGESAPEAVFEMPGGARATLADFRGKPVLLNLWATWCAPCIKEMPTLDALAGKTAGTLQVLAISQDFKGAEVVTPFFAKAGYKMLKPYLDSEMTLSLGLGVNLPTTILYDAAGKEVWRFSGDMDWAGPEAAKLVAEAS